MNLKETFLNLTEYTIPFKHEYKLEKYLPTGFKKDSVGNYYIQIGNSETLFTTHLDTYSKKYEKVNHVIEGNVIRTDESTILGGDNKLGMCILLGMIEMGIPGTYFFFCGEEPCSGSGGLWGSRNALSENKAFFKKFKRAVAFDRKQTGSVVTRQIARNCCSEEFANALCNELTTNGVPSKPDPNAYYTDTATFLDTIPECTNISAGGWDEHYNTEWVDLDYTQKVLNAACVVNWETLPVANKINDYDTVILTKQGFITRAKNKNLINKIKKFLNEYDLMLTNELAYNSGSTNTMLFNTWFKEINLGIELSDRNIAVTFNSEVTNFELNDIVGVKNYIRSIFGFDFEYKKYDIGIFEDGTVGIMNQQFDSFNDYIEHYKSINKFNTSFVIKKGGLQYQDDEGDLLSKDLIINWFKSIE